nr:DUF433 domain-containing protein [Thiocapsa bogorovii]
MGRPCLRGMRIRVSDILEMLTESVTTADILCVLPNLEAEGLKECLLFAAASTATLGDGDALNRAWPRLGPPVAGGSHGPMRWPPRQPAQSRLKS